MASNGNEHGLFWGSNGGDRKYNAESFERWLKKFFTTGVFNGDLQVVEDSGMTLSVGTGYANVDGKVRFWDVASSVTISPANSTYPRIDSVMITRDNVNRDIYIEVITGAYSGDNPEATAPIRNAEKFQMVLAEIYVEHGATEITQADITDKRQDTSVCGYITGTVTEMDFSQFAAQFNSYYQQFVAGHEADFDAWEAAQKAAWDAWYAELVEELHELPPESAEYLQVEIMEIRADLEKAGGSIVTVTTATEEFFGKTVTLGTYESAFDLTTGVAEFHGVLEVGDLTLACEDVSKTVNIPYFGNYEFEIHKVAFDVQEWLTAGRVSGTYADLDAVLADEKALRQLFLVHDSVDYLVQACAEELAQEVGMIINDDYCAKWINLSDYALDTLYANEFIHDAMDEADKYFYGEWALMPQVPKMTSNTAPYGEASASSVYSASYAWKAFDNSTSTNWTSADDQYTNSWVKYDFGKSIKVISFYLKSGLDSSHKAISAYKIQGSNDDFASDVHDLYEGTNSQQSFEILQNLTSAGVYRYYRVLVESVLDSSNAYITEIQFYAWAPKGNVPVMTSNTAPYGEVFADGYESSSYIPWHAFDGEPIDSAWYYSGGSSTHYVGYRFVNPILAKKCFMLYRGPSTTISRNGWDLKIQASNDNTTWIDLCETISVSNVSNTLALLTFSLNTDTYYLYYRLVTSNPAAGNTSPMVQTLQFYGRELKVSVPTMTGPSDPYGTASASSEYNYGHGYPAWHGFTNGSTDGWIPNSTSGWIQYDFGKKVVAKIFQTRNISNGSAVASSRPSTVSIQASNDGTTWTTLKENISVLGTSGYTVSESLNNDTEYRYYRANTVATSENNPFLGCINFYGLDYSEKEFEVGTNKKWLYDHGVELEEHGDVYEQGTISVEFGPNEIECGTYSGFFGLQTKNKIDLTPYNHVRAISKIETTSTWILGYLNALGDNYDGYIASGSMIPDHVTLDISNASGEYRIALTSTLALTSTTSKFRWQELWLE